MVRKMASYQVKPEMVTAIEAAIGEFVTAILEAEPGTTYTAYRIHGENCFVHFMAFPDQDAEESHQTAAYTLKFVQVLYPNCEIQPQFFDLDLISS